LAVNNDDLDKQIKELQVEIEIYYSQNRRLLGAQKQQKLDLLLEKK
jgi:hypothetical protein